jgi:SAM-dependent methyltransferase
MTLALRAWGDGNGTLPIDDHSLDTVIGGHTIYFWPAPAATLADIARALRPGDRFVLAFRASEHPLPARFDPTVYHVPTTSQACDGCARPASATSASSGGRGDSGVIVKRYCCRRRQR